MSQVTRKDVRRRDGSTIRFDDNAGVILENLKEKLPKGFQRSEFLYRHGFVDRIVQRADLRQELAQVLRFLAPTQPWGKEAARG